VNRVNPFCRLIFNRPQNGWNKKRALIPRALLLAVPELSAYLTQRFFGMGFLYCDRNLLAGTDSEAIDTGAVESAPGSNVGSARPTQAIAV
jgi:hypothetical protein